MPLQSINPATGQLIQTYPELSFEGAQEKLRRAHGAFDTWSKQSFEQRGTLMRAMAAHLREKKYDYGKIMTTEMGKPITEAQAEIEKCAWACDYYADHAESFLSDEAQPTEAQKSYIRYVPLGVILAVMPWNFPFWQVFRFAAPTLMAGNTALVKHASNVSGCSLAIESAFREVGFPEGVLQSLLVPSAHLSPIIESPLIQAVTLTGSNSAGVQVAQLAGQHLKKTVLELGGSDPFVVLKDADIEAAATGAVQSRFINSGQSCIAAKRFIVMEEVADAFELAFRQKIEALNIGDPMDPQTQIGPMARGDLREGLHEQVQKSIERGAKLLTGGHFLEDRSGYFYAPTLLSQVTNGMPVYDEETFGPVAAVIRVKSLEEAVQVANDTPYGLGGSVWSKNLEEAQNVALQIQAGAVFINGIVKSDPRLPFGGTKQSGYGRELSKVGIHEFVNIQTVWIK